MRIIKTIFINLFSNCFLDTQSQTKIPIFLVLKINKFIGLQQQTHRNDKTQFMLLNTEHFCASL